MSRWTSVISDGSLKFLTTWCPATEIMDFIFVPSFVIPKILPDMTFSFSPCLLGSCLSSSSVVLLRMLNFSRRSVLSSSDLTHCSTSFVASFCLTFSNAVLAAKPQSTLSGPADSASRFEATTSSGKVFTFLVVKVLGVVSFLRDSASFIRRARLALTTESASSWRGCFLSATASQH